jgi:hypothetical protein
LSQTQPIGGQTIGAAPAKGGTEVRAAIARAAQATGVDFNYLLAQAKLESSLDPSARAGTSSAAGLYQFTGSTWLQTLERHGADHGLGWTDGAIDAGRLRDPAMRGQVMAMRHDPGLSSLMAAELANDNKAALTGVLGREPDAAELYLAHFLGSGGASQFLSALSADPDQSAAAILPAAARANRTIFYDQGGAPRSVGGVMELLRGRVNGAMEGGDDASAWAVQDGLAAIPSAPAVSFAPAVSGGPIAREFAFAQRAAPSLASGPPRASMADTLLTAFSLNVADGKASPPSFVRTAYSQLKVLGL